MPSTGWHAQALGARTGGRHGGQWTVVTLPTVFRVWTNPHCGGGVEALEQGWTGVWVADDLVAKLTDQVRDLEQPGWYDTNPALRFQCFISADGKGMQASHRLDGAKCWTCAHQVDGPLAGVPGPLCFQFPVRFFPWFSAHMRWRWLDHCD